MVYALDDERREQLVEDAIDATAELPGIDLVLARTGGEARVITGRGELRFAPGGDLDDLRGGCWNVDGDLAALGAEIEDGRFSSSAYPNALERIWGARQCPTAGDVLLSAAPGHEFVDWGGADHVGGGSHGSLHATDSLGALLWCGTGPDSNAAREQWSLRDVAVMVREHFGTNWPPA